MKIGERIKEIRTKLQLNQSEFAERIGIGQAALSALEKGIRNVTERNILLISESFNINETWLRTGIGDMFIKTESSLLSQLATEYNLSETEQKILSIYLHMDELHRDQLVDFASYFASELTKASITETSATIEPINDVNLTRNQKETLIKQELDAEDAEEKGLKLSAFTSTSGSCAKES